MENIQLERGNSNTITAYFHYKSMLLRFYMDISIDELIIEWEKWAKGICDDQYCSAVKTYRRMT